MTRSRARTSKTAISSLYNGLDLSPELGSLSPNCFVPSFDSILDPFLPSVFERHDPGYLTKEPDPDQYTVIPATLKILKVLIVELQSASGAARDLDAAAAAELAEEGSNDDEWEDEPNPFADLGTGLSKEQLMAYAADDGPNMGRQRDDETQAFLVDFFKRAAQTQGFQEEFQALSLEEQGRLQESAA